MQLKCTKSHVSVYAIAGGPRSTDRGVGANKACIAHTHRPRPVAHMPQVQMGTIMCAMFGV